jgi:hypothetical protein
MMSVPSILGLESNLPWPEPVPFRPEESEEAGSETIPSGRWQHPDLGYTVSKGSVSIAAKQELNGCMLCEHYEGIGIELEKQFKPQQILCIAGIGTVMGSSGGQLIVPVDDLGQTTDQSERRSDQHVCIIIMKRSVKGMLGLVQRSD